MEREWRYGSEVFVVKALGENDELTDANAARPVVWTAEKTAGGLTGYGHTQAAAIADYKRTSRDRVFATRDGMCSG